MHNNTFKPYNSTSEVRFAREKVCNIDDLGSVSASARTAGQSVVLCHGVFDLVHMGHIRHLESARREGDILIVTVTADRYVNKGPGRPIFSERMRAEMLAAVEYVDWVAINPNASAELALEAIKPNVYVKGSDYENLEEDITGKISGEREVVERHGGRIVFTKDITFSSSELINRYLDVYDPPLRDLLDNLRTNDGPARILELIQKARQQKIVVIGDTIIDEYQYVNAMGKSTKENIIATQFQNSEVFAGGVIAAANHAAEFCSEVEIVTTLEEGCPYKDMILDVLKSNVRLNIVSVSGRPTTRKLRYVEQSYMRKLFEVYFMDDRQLSDTKRQELKQIAIEKVAAADVTVVTDFGHGMIDVDLADTLRKAAGFLAVNAQTNSGNQGFNLITKYHGADFVCIDAPEARLAAADKHSDITRVTGEILPKLIDCEKLVVTHGSSGCYTMDRKIPRKVGRIPAFTKTVVDTVGAGDAFFAVTAPMVPLSANIEDIGFIGNAAGAMKVGIVGHRKSIEKVPLMKFISTLLK